MLLTVPYSVLHDGDERRLTMQILVKPVMLDEDDEEQDVVAAYCDLTICNCNDKGCVGNGGACTGNTGDDEVDDLLF